MKRVTFNGVRFEVEGGTKKTVKNIETGGYIRKEKNQIAALKDETIRLYLDSSILPYEFWTKEDAINMLNRFKFKWQAAELFDGDGILIDEIKK